MVDVKKFITGFLILAAITSSSALFLSSIIPSRNNSAKTEPAKAFSNNFPPSLLSQNAFVESLPAAAPRPLTQTSEDGLPPIIPTNNLTENLAQQLTREMFAANPDGPINFGGEFVLAVPDTDKILGNVETKNISLPDFPAEIPESEIKISAKSGDEEEIKYLGEIDAVLTKTIVSKQFDELLKKAPSWRAISSAQLVYGETYKKLSDISVPATLAQFHKSLLTLVSNQKSLADLPTNYPQDPAMAAILTEAAKEKIGFIIARDIENYEKELNSIKHKLSFAGNKSNKKEFRLTAALLGAKISHALTVPTSEFGGPISIPTKIASWGEWLQILYQWAQDILLQQLKNQLINIIQRDIIGWIQGGGRPKFITNWKEYLGDIFNKAAGAAIEQIVPGACQSFQPLLRISLQTPPPPSGGSVSFGTSCTLDRIVDNVRNFYNDFSQGGFIAYGAMAHPTGNYFGTLIDSFDQKIREAASAKEDAKNKALAGSGSPGTAVCEDGSDHESNGGLCEDGTTPRITTPGKTIIDSLAKGLGSNVDLVVNANNIPGLLAAAINAAINRLIKEGVNGLTGVFRSSPTNLGSNYSGVSGSELGPQPPGSTPDTAAQQGTYTGPTGGGAPTGPSPSTPTSTSPSPSPTPTPAMLACSPSSQTISIGGIATLTASGGTGNYSWAAPGGSIVSGQNTEQVDIQYFLAGTRTVFLSDLDASGNAVTNTTCEVNIQ